MGQGAELVDEDLVVGDVVGDGGDGLDRRRERDNPGPQARIRLAALQMVADQMVGDRRRAAVATDIDGLARRIGTGQQGTGLGQRHTVDGGLGGLRGLEIGLREGADVGEFFVRESHAGLSPNKGGISTAKMP